MHWNAAGASTVPEGHTQQYATALRSHELGPKRSWIESARLSHAANVLEPIKEEGLTGYGPRVNTHEGNREAVFGRRRSAADSPETGL